MNTIKIKPRFFSEELLEKIEKIKDAKFVVETSVRDFRGNWVNLPMAIFYCKEKHPVSDSRYFAFYYNESGQSYVTNGQSAVDEPFTVIEQEGEYFNSVFRHDYNSLGSVAIDGGRDYCRIIGNPTVKTAKIVENRVELIEEVNNES